MIVFFTLVLDGLPWIATHFATFSQLPIQWHWIVVEGVADSAADTRWCKRIAPRLSIDGTSEYLDSLKDDRVTVLREKRWNGKVAMCNAALELIVEPCLLWQVDSDEVWGVDQILSVWKHFGWPHQNRRNCAYFWCRYFVGADIYVLNRNCYGNNPAYEWKRVWQFTPGMRFKTHEPPALEGFRERPFWHNDTERIGAVFDHYAYATESQVRFKEEYYGSANNTAGALYRNAVANWRRLQENTIWPTKLKPFMPWVDDRALVSRLIDRNTRRQ